MNELTAEEQIEEFAAKRARRRTSLLESGRITQEQHDDGLLYERVEIALLRSGWNPSLSLDHWLGGACRDLLEKAGIESKMTGKTLAAAAEKTGLPF